MSIQGSRRFFTLLNTPNLVIIFVVMAYLATNFTHHKWTRDKGPDRGVISWDIISYYAYLPATFIYGDVGLSFATEPGFVNDNKFWYNTTDIGERLIITSMGLSFLYAPFFFMAHALAPLFGEARSGFNSIYQFFLVFSALFYVIAGLLFLKKILLKYFEAPVVAITLLGVGLGTNLYYYATYEAAMTHSYDFALITVFLYLVINWHDRITYWRSLLVGITLGLISLVRPTNILVLLLFIFWNINSGTGLLDRLRYFIQKSPHIILMIVGFILIWLPQCLYWKNATGHFLFYSYGPHGDRFFFGNPHLFEILFSYRKGWLLYTPLMIFALFGFYRLDKHIRGAILPVLVYLFAMIYVQASWWTWWFGGSFGSRVFVDAYGILALPLAATVNYAFHHRWKLVSGTMAGVFIFLLILQVLQTRQYISGTLHWEGMTKEAYWKNFLKIRPADGYWQMLSVPDAVLARKSIYVSYHTGEDISYLTELSGQERKEYIAKEIRRNRILMRDIRLYAKREGVEESDALEMVAIRIVEEKLQLHGKI